MVDHYAQRTNGVSQARSEHLLRWSIRQTVAPKLLWECLKDHNLWPLYLIGLMSFIPATPPQNYLALILRTMGFSTFHANLLTIPSQVLYGVQPLLITCLSERFNQRSIVASLSNWWFLPFLIALVALGSSASDWVRYALLTGLLGYPYQHAIQVGWNSRNSNGVRIRAVSAALYNMFVQSGNIISSNIYRDHDKPYYNRDNRDNQTLLGISGTNIFLYVLFKLSCIRRNKQKEKKWSVLSAEHISNYIQVTKDEGEKKLDFGFAH